jgi:hypothetical protein
MDDWKRTHEIFIFTTLYNRSVYPMSARDAFKGNKGGRSMKSCFDDEEAGVRHFY